MSDPTDEIRAIWLEEALRQHAIDASVFAPFVIARLRDLPDDSDSLPDQVQEEDPE